MPTSELIIIEKLTKRLSEIEEFLRENRETLEPQKHVDVFSSERVYWHAGYASALKDILTTLQGTGETPSN
jgi:hypothetical protein